MRSGGGASVARAARRTSSIERGPSSVVPAMKAVVCSGAMLKPSARSSAGKARNGRAAAGNVMRRPRATMVSRRGPRKTRSSSSLSAVPIARRNASGQGAPWRLSSVAPSAQSIVSAMPGGLASGSRRRRPTAATTARAVAAATPLARIITISASSAGLG